MFDVIVLGRTLRYPENRLEASLGAIKVSRKTTDNEAGTPLHQDFQCYVLPREIFP